MDKRPKGVLSLEYALLISVVVVALIGMSAYLGRSVSGRWREAGDSFGFGRQYEEPAYNFVLNFSGLNFNFNFIGFDLGNWSLLPGGWGGGGWAAI